MVKNGIRIKTIAKKNEPHRSFSNDAKIYNFLEVNLYNLLKYQRFMINLFVKGVGRKISRGRGGN